MPGARERHHTSKWPEEGVDFTGKRVGVIGTGSTGIQVIPVVAEQAAHLTVFQRTANFSIPSRNRPVDEDYERDWKQNYREYREMMKSTASAAGLTGQRLDRSVLDVSDEEREEILERAWESRSGFKFTGSFKDVRTNIEANEVVAEFARRKIRQIVKDPAVAELLCPDTHPLGTKRLCLDSGYYETFNRPNVTLVDVRNNPVTEITPAGLRTTAGKYELDILIYATGFDAMTGSMTRMNVTGAGGGPARGQVGQRPDELPRVPGGRVPEPVHDPRAGQPVGARPDDHERGVAGGLAARPDRLHARARLRPGGDQRVVVYVGGFDNYARRCDEVVSAGYEGFTFR